MKKIQLITNNPSKLTNYDKNITINNFNNLKALDDYDINIFNLNCDNMWENKSTTDSKPTLEMKLSSDFRSIHKMIINSNKSINIICLPQNLYYRWRCYSDNKSEQLKDMIPVHIQHLKQLIPLDSLNIIYENSETLIETYNINASFYMDKSDYEPITYSNNSNKITTIKKDKLIVTTLEIINNNYDVLLSYLVSIKVIEKIKEYPEWIYKYYFNDDEIQNANIDAAKEQIKIQKEIIENANKKIQENLHYKSILFTNSNELVDVVFEILEQIFDISLSDFNDAKKEDFLFKKNDITYIGEIKGVSSNVKYEHISQLDVHFSKYLDYLQENNLHEKIIKILIINYERTKDISLRDEINEMQIELAEKNKTLIIDTKSLLYLYEMILNNKIKKESIVDYINKKVGLINISDIN